jgi:hypothetical protein
VVMASSFIGLSPEKRCLVPAFALKARRSPEPLPILVSAG